MSSSTPEAQRHLSPHEVDALLAGVDGWLGPIEGRLLFRLAAEADPAGVIVEIGSWHGRSTIWLAAGAQAGLGAHVVAVDPHSGTHLRPEGVSTEQVLRDNLSRSGLQEHVEVMVATSSEAAARWSTPVSLLWIDGDHGYESALRDFELWEPYLLPDAVVALHDTFVTQGPERVVREKLIAPGHFTAFVHAETTTAARRCVQLSPRDAMARRVALARRSLYGIRLRAYDRNRLGFATVRDVFRGR